MNHLILACNDFQDRAHRRWFELHFPASVSLGLSGPDRERWMFLDVVSGGRRVAGGAISKLPECDYGEKVPRVSAAKGGSGNWGPGRYAVHDRICV